MKNTTLIKNLCATLLLFVSFSAFNQGNYLLQYAVDSAVYSNCDQEYVINISPEANYGLTNSDLDVTLNGANYQNGPLNVVVDWGDGTSSTHGGSMTGVGNNVSFNPPLAHNYQASGTYIIVMQITNPSNNTSFAHTVLANAQMCNTGVFAYTSNLCTLSDPNLLSNGVPLVFTNLLTGVETTVNTANGIMSQTFLTGGDYSVNIDSGWLTFNGLAVASFGGPSTVTISPAGGGALTFQIILDCAGSGIMNCLSGVVFCDGNQNGIMDGNEDYIPYAQVDIETNIGFVYTVTANVDGFYTLNYLENLMDFWVGPNGTWLAANSASGNSVMINNSIPCAQNGVSQNLAVLCDTNQAPTSCVGGWVFCDSNNSGFMDANETGLANVPVTITGQNNVSVVVYTNQYGSFYYSGNDLGVGVGIASIDPAYLTQNGYTYNQNPFFSVYLDCNMTQPVYFPIVCGQTTPCVDLWSYVTPWIGYYQNQTNYIQMSYGNYGPAAPQSYTVTLTFPAGATPVTSTISNPNYVISGNTITWTINSSLTWFSSSDVIGFSLPGGLTNGVLHTYTVSIAETGTNEDCYTYNNQGALEMFLGNSYDPNDKSVNLPEMISPDVQDEFTFHIRFQNTGTAPAQDIYILDTLSTNLDWSTFELLDATHSIQIIDLGNGVMKFNFPDIWLPDSTTNLEASQGSLTYKIQENAGNGIGTAIENTAYIYFDWNPAIITNTTFNENNVLSVEAIKENNLEVYPNPVTDVLTIRSDENVSSVKVYDLTGKLISVKSGTSIQSISMVDMKTGVYLVEMTIGNQTTTKRVIKK